MSAWPASRTTASKTAGAGSVAHPFPREHIRHGDSTAKLYVRCLKHSREQCSSAAALARQKAVAAARTQQDERQTIKQETQLGRPLPAGNLRKLLCPAFAAKLAETAQGKLFAATSDDEDRRLLSDAPRYRTGIRGGVGIVMIKWCQCQSVK